MRGRGTRIGIRRGRGNYYRGTEKGFRQRYEEEINLPTLFRIFYQTGRILCKNKI